MVWIHGGGYKEGDSVQGSGLFNGSGLVESQGLVVVTTNYRLGAFGFLGSVDLRDQDGSTGNFGLQDQRAAMFFVRQHIALFGGDPSRVTIFGCSAGAMSVSVHYVAPRSRGLFATAIAESGAFDSRATQPMALAEEAFQVLSTRLGCFTVDCLRATSAEELRDAANHVMIADDLEGIRYSVWAPTVDGVELEAEAWQLLRSGAHSGVPMILGSNRDETSASYFDVTAQSRDLDAVGLRAYVEHSTVAGAGGRTAIDEVIGLYNPDGFPKTECCSPHYWAAMRMSSDWEFICSARRAARWLSSTSTAYLYLFTHLTDRGSPVSDFQFVPHGSQRAYVFRDLPLISEEDAKHHGGRDVAAVLGEYWANMARSGNPNSNRTTRWNSYSNSTDEAMLLDAVPKVQPMLRNAQCDFWDKMWSTRTVHNSGFVV